MAEAALQEKNLGNEAYKRKDFPTAHRHYDKAIELDPNNITYYSNKAAVFFEETKYEDCIKTCEKAVEVGREQRADYSLIAKAMARIANSYVKLENYKDALHWYEKSLSEHRDPEVVKKYKQLEKEFKERERLSYINPEISEQEKTLGNESFKKGDYPNAMKHYNEAIKRNPDNAVLYSNRAACYTKLMEFQRAIDDCDTSIKKDPKFIKAYIRKGAALQAIREFTRAQRAYEEALAIDSNNQEARDGLMLCMSSNDENPEKARERALQDPEVQEILRDPSMRVMLEQMSQDPGAVREHLQNPEILRKLMKLRDAGIVQMR
uniref:Stress-induced-phosphoprotein 1 n=1 Tax=Acrobeloides nanus TaxID=290746 RepID=A0A914DXS5_9BILA